MVTTRRGTATDPNAIAKGGAEAAAGVKRTASAAGSKEKKAAKAAKQREEKPKAPATPEAEASVTLASDVPKLRDVEMKDADEVYADGAGAESKEQEDDAKKSNDDEERRKLQRAETEAQEAAQQKEAEERAEAQQREQERARIEEERKKREEVERKQKEEAERARKAEEEKKQKEETERERKAEEERKRKEEEETKRKEEERRRKEEEEMKLKEEAERKQKEEAARKQREEEERKQKEEAERKQKEEAERKQKEEAERKQKEEAERKQKEEAERKQKEETERKQKEEAERKQKEEAERKQKEEEEQRRKDEEEQKRKAEEAHQRAEEQRREEERRQEEQKRDEERRQAEDRQRQEAEQQRKEEERRKEEQRRRDEQQREKAEAQRKEEEQKEEMRRQEEARATEQMQQVNSLAGSQTTGPSSEHTQNNNSTQTSIKDSFASHSPSNHHQHSGGSHGMASHPVPAAQKEAIHHSSERKNTSHNVLEKGQIYFFFRGRVDTLDPDSVKDIARTYIVLRPFPHDAAVGHGAVQSATAHGNRVLAVPKKVLPRTPKDRFMIFVELAHASIHDVQTRFLQGSEYSTQTAGVRQTPPAAPIGEGVYALIEAGDTRRETHLAYMLTLPAQPGDVQRDMGIQEKGSFILSAKNPQHPGPANASLDKGPNFPSEILDSFKTRRWAPAEPKMLDYENAQFLLIGSSDSDLQHATQVPKGDHDVDMIDPKTELEKLEDEDSRRVEGLKGDHAIFVDLGLDRNHPGLQQSWQ